MASLALVSAVLGPAWAATAAAASGPLRIVGATPRSGAVDPAAPTLAVTFNQPVSPSSVRYATAVDSATASRPFIGNPTVLRTASPDTVRIDPGTLRPGAYAVVIGPAALSAGGLPLGHPFVFTFVVAPEGHAVAWQRISDNGTTYTVWVTGAAVAPPGLQGERLTTHGRQVLFGNAPVSAVYATDPAGALVTDPALTQQLLLDAEEAAFAAVPPPPASNFINPGDAAWARKNGPGSDLALALYDAAKAAGLSPAAPPSRQSVYETAIASALAEGGAPGQWSGQNAADVEALQGALAEANTGAEAAHIVADLLKEGDISIPGADVLGPLVKVLGAANLGVTAAGSAASQLFQAQWAAAMAAAAAGPLGQISSVTADATLKSAISDMANFNPATVEARVDAAFLRSLAQNAYGTFLGAATKAMAAAGDPMADAVLTGIDVGFFLADFTGWDVVRAGFYQATYESDVENAVAAAAAALQREVAASRAPSPDLVGAELLAVRLQYAIAGDFYQTATDIASKTQWTQLIDGPLAHYVFHGGTPSEEAAAWSRAVKRDGMDAGELLPGAGAATLRPDALLAVGADFPVAAQGVQVIHTCGFRISQPGLYALARTLWSPDAGACAYADGVDIASPGVALTFNGFDLLGGAGSSYGVHVLPGAAGALVADGIITGSAFGTGVMVQATGALITHMVLPVYSQGGIVLDHADGAVIRDDQIGGTSGGMFVSMRRTIGATVRDDVFLGLSQPAEVALVESSGNQILENTFSNAATIIDGVYVGCAPGQTDTSVAHPLTHTSCTPASTGNLIAGNRITMNAGSGPAIVLDNDARNNTVKDNTVLGTGGTYALWDFNKCGVNHWAHDVVKAVADAPSSGFFPSNNVACVK